MSNLKQRLINWYGRKTTPCKEVIRLLSESRERSLTLRERIGIRLHYLICVWCPRYERQLKLLGDAARCHPAPTETPAAPSLSADARERLKRSLRDAEK